MITMMKFWILFLLLIPALTISGLKTSRRSLKVFPHGHTVAGVFQVSYKTTRNQLEYAYNVSEARELCQVLGVTIASKAQVEEALSRGLETCRFGWIDEHFAVIPRVTASEICGKNQTGVVTWRAPVQKQFDVFCFNQTESQLEDATTDSPVAVSEPRERAPRPPLSGNGPSISAPRPPSVIRHPPSQSTPQSRPSTSPPLSPDNPAEEENELPQSVSAAGSGVGAIPKALMISSTFLLFLATAAVLWYFKIKRSWFLCWGAEQKTERVEAEEWTPTWKKDQPEGHREPEEDGCRGTAGDVSVNNNLDSKTDTDTVP
ncbi:lymphatic vessel endothelial hyaluronic acid receptor 1a [Hypomesus transpacificus]|uniref:lymphatic vessel endothelial hyaluronic acid receptor 1a n=1 Tax=Hypomesus transpacificus TaxID=137520 RepID=UPI001F07DC18|nr:lymphatic vessel endothelial hyaluronic acid receptor 1a [Hypomesus transpacificus]